MFCCSFVSLLAALLCLPVVFVVVCRRLSRAALSARRAERRRGVTGIKAQKDGFRVHEPLRVAFLHPDLGIGGAERLIVDAAMGLQNIERKPLVTSPNGQLSLSGSLGNTASAAAGRSRASSLNGTRSSNLPPRSRTVSPTQTPRSSAASPSSPPLRSHRRYDVQVFTNYHDPKRAFEETTDGTLKPIIVLADWIPRHIRNKGHVLFASIRMLVAAIIVVVKYQLTQSTAFDVIIVDQVAAAMPVLKLLAPSWRIYFYCHFPDQLCDPSRMANLNSTIDAKAGRSGGNGGAKSTADGDVQKTSAFQQAKHAYRTLFDQIEIVSMKAADRVNYNSKFSREVTMGVFPFLKATLDDERDILYPPIDVDKALSEPPKPKGSDNPLVDGFSQIKEGAFVRFLHSHRVLTSINRFERKKNINLAVEALAQYARDNHYDAVKYRRNVTSAAGVPSSRAGSAIPVSESLIEGDFRSHFPLALVICGGYDPRLPENVSHHEELVELCTKKNGDIFRVIANVEDYEAEVMGSSANDSTAELSGKDASKIPVIFLRSCTSRAKYLLLENATAVLYTPEREHFGIVPVEAMCFGVPVVAVNNGGPVESIGVGDVNGFLRPANADAFAEAIAKALDPSVSEGISANATARARNVFGLSAFANKMAQQLEELAAAE